MDAQIAEAAILHVSFLRGLRPDEQVRAAGHAEIRRLARGDTFVVEEDAPALVVVASGELEVEAGKARFPLFAGDVVGEADVIVGRGDARRFTATEDAVVAKLDARAMDALLREMPAIALPLVEDLSRDLKWHTDLLREVCIARTEGLAPQQVEVLLRARRRRLHRSRFALRRFGALLVRTLITEPARKPSFWTFAGVVLALASARTVVALILANNLQKKLFALIEGQVGHPIHVHHFNYGLALVSIVGLLSMIPSARRAMRFLSFAFGFGLGLVVDEFALFWNLNPDYYQPSSRLAAGLVLFVLAQIVYFRSLYAAAAKRLLARVRA